MGIKSSQFQRRVNLKGAIKKTSKALRIPVSVLVQFNVPLHICMLGEERRAWELTFNPNVKHQHTLLFTS